MSFSIAGRAAPALALVIATATPPAHAQTREVRFTCQGGGPMVVELSPAQNGQVIVAIRAALADPGDQAAAAGTCIPADNKFHERAQRAAAQLGGPRNTPIMLRMTTRQPLVLNVEVPSDQSPRVVLSSRRNDARAEEALQLYQTAIQGRAFTVTVREARNPLDLPIVGSSTR